MCCFWGYHVRSGTLGEYCINSGQISVGLLFVAGSPLPSFLRPDHFSPAFLEHTFCCSSCSQHCFYLMFVYSWTVRNFEGFYTRFQPFFALTLVMKCLGERWHQLRNFWTLWMEPCRNYPISNWPTSVKVSLSVWLFMECYLLFFGYFWKLNISWGKLNTLLNFYFFMDVKCLPVRKLYADACLLQIRRGFGHEVNQKNMKRKGRWVLALKGMHCLEYWPLRRRYFSSFFCFFIDPISLTHPISLKLKRWLSGFVPFLSKSRREC